jgi:hypothetical protein
MYYLSVLAIFKNETMNLKLWIDHYLWQGVDHFYLIDNGSNDNPLSILNEYINKGIVSYFYLPERHKQVDHYRFVFDNQNIKNKTQWLAVCDLDEFFFGVDQKLTTKIKSLEPYYDYILCNWKMFGSNGLLKHPPDIRTAITHCEKSLHENTKYIFKPNIIKDSSQIWIHSLVNISNINPKRIRVANQLIKLNHYPIQSQEFFRKVKMTRGDVDNGGSENVRNITYFNSYDQKSNSNDEALKNIIFNPPINY